jgi:hypothetical protein
VAMLLVAGKASAPGSLRFVVGDAI